MKLKELKIMTTISIVTLLTIQEASAQLGMDNAGNPPAMYSRLRRAPLPFLQFQQNEKALGVYTSEFNPSSTLEINTTTAYLPFLHPNLGGDRGLVFRSVAPAGFTQQWQMFRDNNQVFRLFNTLGIDDVTLETVQNGAMQFATNNIQRMIVNGDRTATIGAVLGGFNVPTNGYVGIGPNTLNLWSTKGPFSLLHLNGGSVPGPVQDLGYRPWMQTGVSFTDFNDFAYVGYRNVGGNTNEFVINWSNDIATYGPDDMAFRFTREYDFTVPNPPTNGRIDNDFTKSDDMDGRHIARFTPTGEFGLGPNFGYTIDNSAYVRPQSMFHMSSYKQQDTWFQITNQTGTAETAADGLRIGITDTGTAHIKQQEALPLVLYTGAVEDVRIVPASASTLTGNHGMVGIGNFSLDTLDAKLDINGDLRIRTVTQRDTLLQVLVIDSNDHNRVHWRNIGGLGGNATAFNGTSIDTATSQVQLGQDVGDSLNPAMLVNNRQVPMNNFNIQFDGLGVQGANQISVGAPSPIPTLTGDTNLTSKFSTYNEDDLIAGSFVSDEQNFSGSSFGFTSSGDFIRTNMIGVAGIALKKNFDFAVGVYGTAAQANIGGSTLRGVVGQIRFGGNKTKAIGVHGIGENTKGGQNYGGYFEALGSPNNNIGVFCTAPVTPSTFPPTPPSNLALFADGDVFVSGTAYLANPAVVSDQQFKTNIDSLQNALQIITQLNPRNFEYVASLSPKLNFPLGEQYGFIAQEVEQVLPTIISEGIIPEVYDSLGNIVESAIQYKSLNYNALIAILTKGMQEQQINIDSLHHVVNEQDSINNDLETRLAFLESCIRNANICEEGNRTINQNPNSGINQKSIELINTNGIILDQNLPNPFAENTVINYNIPTEVAEAKLLFYDLNGRIIKELVIEERGESKLTVYGSNLKTGVYTYSLIADGELIATKKMVKK